MDELTRIRQVLEQMDVPEWVVRMHPELIYDSQDERAVAIRVVVIDSAIAQPLPGRPRGMFRVDVIKAFQEAGIELYPYVRFIAESEADLVP